MIILLEGPDGAGKTTFASLLHRHAPRPVNTLPLKSGPPIPGADPFDEYERRLYPYINLGNDVVADRWHWGERVYGPLLRQRDRLGVAGWRHVELFLAGLGAVVVYLHQPGEVLVDRLAERGDDLIKKHMLADVDLGYQACIRDTALPVLSFRDPGPEDARLVWQVANHVAADRNFHYLYPTYVGPQRPDVLLFGERRNDPTSGDRSAFVPRKSTSGRWLFDCLGESFWPRIGVANALEERPLDLWHELDRPPVVSLGAMAHKELTRVGVPHGAVPHPQFVRRFLHSDLCDYGRLVERTAGTDDDHTGWRGNEEVA